MGQENTQTMEVKTQVKEITEEVENTANASPDVKAQVTEITEKVEKTANGSPGVKAQVKGTTEKVASNVKSQVKDTAKSVEKLAVDNPVVRTAHSGILVGLGAVAAGKEKTDSVMERLVEKGEVAAKDLQKMWHDLFSQGKEDVTKVEEKLEGMLDQRITAVLQRMNIPNKTDLDGLNEKVGALTLKVAELDKKLTLKKAA
jgi:poly(hydroxyalkanoate) granule-associated protein